MVIIFIILVIWSYLIPIFRNSKNLDGFPSIQVGVHGTFRAVFQCTVQLWTQLSRVSVEARESKLVAPDSAFAAGWLFECWVTNMYILHFQVAILEYIWEDTNFAPTSKRRASSCFGFVPCIEHKLNIVKPSSNQKLFVKGGPVTLKEILFKSNTYKVEYLNVYWPPVCHHDCFTDPVSTISTRILTHHAHLIRPVEGIDVGLLKHNFRNVWCYVVRYLPSPYSLPAEKEAKVERANHKRDITSVTSTIEDLL